MPFWIAILISIAFSIAGQLLAPKVEGPKPDDTPKVPDIDETRSIPVLWGEWLIRNPQLFWWGDYRSVAQKKKIFTGLWFKKITTGFKYELGMALALCDAGSAWHTFANFRGVEKITEIQVNEKVLWSGTADQNDVIAIDAPSFFGGSKDGGNGGIKAEIEVHTGDYTPSLFQTVSTYLATQLAITPQWRGLCYLVWRGPSAGSDIGWYGNSSSIQPIAIKAVRRPNLDIFLPLVGTTTFSNIDGPNGELDANPAHCLAELFMNPDWGMGDVNSTDFDHVSWRAAAETLYNEGNGFSYYWDQQTSVEDMAEIILRQIDGVVYTDYATGKLVLKLARNDFDVDDLDTFDNENFIEITDLTRGSWDDTINEVRVGYTDHSKNFKSVTVFDQDLANFVIQESEGVNSNINYPGVSNEALARSLARRDLQVLTQPLLRFSASVDRTAHGLTPGSVFIFSWPEEGIESVVMRVTSIKLGTLEDGVIQLQCVEDKFAAATALFTGTSTGWSEPVGDAVAVTHGNTQELPYWFAKDLYNRIFSFAERPDSSQQSYNLQTDSILEESVIDFTPSGVLDADMPFISNSPVTQLVNAVTDNTLILIPSNAADAAQGISLVMIDDEIMAFGPSTGGISGGGFSGTTGVSGADFFIEVYSRGLLGTTPAKHLAGARVWFLGTHIGRSETTYADGHSTSSKFITQTLKGELPAASSSTYTTTLATRAARPYAPGYVQFNTNLYYGTPSGIIPDSGDITVTWKRRNRLTEVSPFDDDYLGSGDITPEYAETYTLKIYGDSNVLLRTVTGLTGTSYVYTNAFETSDGGGLQGSLTFVLYAVREGLTSWQAVRIALTRTGGSVPGSLPSFTPSGSYAALPAPVAGIPVSATPTNGQALIYNSTTGAWTPGVLGGAPTGTGFRHMTSGVEDGAAKLVDTADINADQVTYAKIQNVSATSRILGRKSSGSGDIEELTLSEALDFISSAAQGDLLYRGSSTWARLPAGTSGYMLKTNGSSSNPSWISLSDVLDLIGSAAQGDILYRGASGWARLPAGTSGQFLKTLGASANPAWGDPTGSGGVGGGILFFNCNTATVPSSSTRYGAFGWTSLISDENTINFNMPCNATFKHFTVHVHTAQPSSGNMVITVRDNGSNTAMTLTVPSSGGVASYDDTHSVSVSAGHYISVGFVNNATAASGGIASVAVQYDFA